MKKTCSVLFAAICGAIGVFAQQQIPNANLEEWTLTKGSGAYKDYEEPSGGWTSGNGVIHIAAGADPVCEKSTEAYSGTACAKLTTQSIFGQIASGSLFLGVFQLSLVNPASSARRGIPFSGPVPTMFRGHYRYTPVAGDSAVIYAMFTKWDGTKRVVLGEARLKIQQDVPVWTSFQIPVPALDQQPDSMSVVAASSAGGENFRGSVGSTLWIDDLSFGWDPTSVAQTNMDHLLRVAGTTLSVSHSSIVHVYAIDLLGRTEYIGSAAEGTWSTAHLRNGVWCLRASQENGTVLAQKLWIAAP